MTETEIWTKWESQVVNGIFPLRRFLGRSNHSVVFLTECRAQNLANAAIKIIPADPARAESQLSCWQLAASLPHPRLVRLLDAGRCKLGGHPFLFVVTEYSEQNLAQILPHRALTLEEVRDTAKIWCMASSSRPIFWSSMIISNWRAIRFGQVMPPTLPQTCGHSAPRLWRR
jgi:hypothetical protein